jgi:hypothetical protein
MMAVKFLLYQQCLTMADAHCSGRTNNNTATAALRRFRQPSKMKVGLEAIFKRTI